LLHIQVSFAAFAGLFCKTLHACRGGLHAVVSSAPKLNQEPKADAKPAYASVAKALHACRGRLHAVVPPAKDAYVCSKRDLHMQQKRPAYAAKETCICSKRDLHMQQKRRTYVAKETGEAACRGLVVSPAPKAPKLCQNAYGKRDLHTSLKKPTHVTCGNSDLHMCQNRPRYVAKET